MLLFLLAKRLTIIFTSDGKLCYHGRICLTLRAVMSQAKSMSKNHLLLYGDDGYDSHVVRYLLAIKNVEYGHSYLKSERPEDLIQLNPYGTLPTLIHGQFIFYELTVIFEYLEERYVQPKLLPYSAQQRAQVRQLAWRIQKDWLGLARHILRHPDSFDAKQFDTVKKELSDSLVTLSPLFAHQPYFLSDSLGWCDVLLAPMLWQLKEHQLKLPNVLVKPLLAYQKRLFTEPAFVASLVY